MSTISQQANIDILVNADTAQDALRNLTKEMDRLKFAAKGASLHGLTGDADALKSKLEELANAGKNAGHSMQGLRSASHFLRMGGLAAHSHGLTEIASVLRGVSFMGAGAVPVIAGLGAALGLATLAGAAFSDTFADKVGGALFDTREEVEATEKAFARLHHRLEDIGAARKLGLGTLEEQHAAHVEAQARSPHEQAAQRMRNDMGALQAHAQALRMFPDNPFNPTHDALEQLHEQAKDRAAQMGGHAAPLIRAKDLTNLAAQPFETPAHLKRQAFEAKDAIARNEMQREAMTNRLSRLDRFKAITKRADQLDRDTRASVPVTKEEEERKKNIEKLENWGKKGTANSASGDTLDVIDAERMKLPLGMRNAFGGANVTESLEYLKSQQEAVEKQRKEGAKNLPEHQALLKEREGLGVGNDPAKVDEERLRILKDIEQVDQRIIDGKKQQVEVENASKQANIENLKTIQATVAEQLKAAAAARRSAEAEMRGHESQLGLMNDKDLRKTDKLLRKMQSGEKLSRKELQQAMHNPVLHDDLQNYARKRAQANPLARDIRDRTDAAGRQKQAGQAEKDLGKADKKLRDEIVGKMAKAGEEMAKDFERIVVPAMTKAIAQAMKNAFIAAAHAADVESQKHDAHVMAFNHAKTGGANG